MNDTERTDFYHTGNPPLDTLRQNVSGKIRSGERKAVEQEMTPERRQNLLKQIKPIVSEQEFERMGDIEEGGCQLELPSGAVCGATPSRVLPAGYRACIHHAHVSPGYFRR